MLQQCNTDTFINSDLPATESRFLFVVKREGGFCTRLILFLSLLLINSVLSARSKEPVNFNTFIADAHDTLNKTAQPTHYSPSLIAELPMEVKETSGLVFFDNMLWTINDGGNQAGIYQLDTATGKVLSTVIVGNAANIDWESITQDTSHVFIGDFGNNSGSRTDLRILKIAKSDLKCLAQDTVVATIIQFRYPDQEDFKPAMNNTNFDCEAFFFHNDSLHLFSKNWADQQTRHYTLPAVNGNFEARLIETFPADGLITDASINEQGNIVLLGYKNTGGRFWDCFCWLLSGYPGNTFFGGQKTRIELGTALHIGQSEAIILNNNNTAWLSSESIQASIFFLPAKLYGLDLNAYFSPMEK